MPCEHAISCLVQSGSKSMSHELGMPHGVRPAAAHRRTATSPRRPVGRRPATRKRSFSPADRSPDGAPGPRCATADCPHPAECMRGTHHGGACVRKKGPSSVHARTGFLGAPFIETAAPHASLGSTTKYRPVQSHGAYVVKRVDSVIDHQSWESPVVRTTAMGLRAAGAEHWATPGHVVVTLREVLFCRWGACRSEYKCRVQAPPGDFQDGPFRAPQNDRFNCQSRHGTVHSGSLAWCVGLAPCVRWNIETAMGVHRVCEFCGPVALRATSSRANSGPGCVDKAGGVGVHAKRRAFGARVSVDRAPRAECVIRTRSRHPHDACLHCQSPHSTAKALPTHVPSS